MYYTDVASVALVLMSYWLTVHRQMVRVGALVSLVSLMFRQTNIVWAAFNAILAIRLQVATLNSVKAE